MADIADRLVETLRRYSPSGEASISREELGTLFQALDSSGYWTEEKLEALLDGTGAGEGNGRVDFAILVKSIFQKASDGDFEAIRLELFAIMDSPDWDDGSYAPLLIRLAWHSSGTYDHESGTGGSNGATMRHALEANDPENAGLAKARELLEPIKERHPWLSYADLWILAACVAIEHTGGPRIAFQGGRGDAPPEKAVAPGRLPGAERGLTDGWKVDGEGRMEGWEKLAQHIRDVFGRMGLSDREAVALLCGGHVYGRCHTEHSGYAGAWVENPTFFSNEYAADMVGDKWIAVEHDTKMPDGGPVPDEVRPAPGKRQYIDLSKYMPDEDEQAARQAPDAKGYPPGRYRCASQWVNCRELPDTGSPIIGRFVQDQCLSLLEVKIFGTAVRGLAERGGWVSIVGSGGKTLFERVSDLEPRELCGRYRVFAAGGAPLFDGLSGDAQSRGRLPNGSELVACEVAFGQDGVQAGCVLARREDASDGRGDWVLMHSPAQGLLCELVVQGYNEKPRRPIKGQTGHQMMLVSDMVLLWDSAFREHLEVYAEDEEALRRDFAAAFQRLTELGCAWSADSKPGCAAAACPASGAVAGGCPFLAAKA